MLKYLSIHKDGVLRRLASENDEKKIFRLQGALREIEMLLTSITRPPLAVNIEV